MSSNTEVSAARRTSRFVVVALCGAAIVVDGYDLIVYGVVLPVLLGGDAEWTLTTPEAGRIGAYALIGMLVGAICIGTVTDLVGRRRIMIGCIAWFSVAMAGAALAPSPELFALARFVAGLGLGGVVPTAIALTIEYAHERHRNATNAAMFCGYSVGGIVVSLLGAVAISSLGWRTMFWIGAALGAALVPLCLLLLPESASYLVARGRRADAERLAARYDLRLEEPGTKDAESVGGLAGLKALFEPGVLRGTLLFWLGCGVGLLLVYGLNTWLAQIMVKAGFGLGSALAFLLALNLGAIVGTPLLGGVADRFGSKPVTVGMFLTASVCIFLLSLGLPTLVQYVLVAVAGTCTIGTTILVNAYTATFYPARMRATGIGWSLGVGRLGAILGPLYGSAILSTGWGLRANFYAFAVPAVIGAIAMLFVPAGPSGSRH